MADIDYLDRMDTASTGDASSRPDFRRTGRWIVGLFWVFQFVALTLASIADGGAFAVRSVEPRAIVLVVGFMLMLGLVEIVARVARHPFGKRLVLTIAWSMLLCLVLVVVNFVVFFVLYGSANDESFEFASYMHVAVTWSWFCVSVAGALLALSYNLEVRDRERKLAAMKAIAGRAQLAALRYQLNPHFLFNTLNSIASLIASRENDPAELMVENLADFLRATLELDPLDDVVLAREIELQRMYLAVEETRFPDRLMVRIDVPEHLADALVPALITQPLVENAIRHAVACSTGPVTVCLSALEIDGGLALVVEDDARPGRSAAKGTGYGLRNVRKRLEGRYGADQSVVAGSLGLAGFRVEMRLPLRRRAAADDDNDHDFD